MSQMAALRTPASTPSQATVLVVEDEVGPRESLKVILGPLCNVVVAHDGVDGLEKFETASPQVIVTDIRMPRMDGFELMRRVRERASDVPFVVVTGYGSLESAQEAIRTGAFDYISKPYDVNQIREVITRAIRHVNEKTRSLRNVETLRVMNARLEDQIRSLQKRAALGDLSAEVVHDLNNPLCVLQGSIAMLEDAIVRGESGDRNQQREFVRVIRAQTDRCISLTQSFLDHARHGSSTWELVSLNDLVRDVLFLLRIRVRTAAVEVVRYLDPDLPATYLQRSAFQQVVYNLAVNAIQAMEQQGGRLTVSTHPLRQDQTDYIEIRVRDTGPGISSEVRDRIFEPYFTTKDRSQGTGLGLAICKRVVEEHSGTITVESTPGEGASFALLIPVQPSPPVGADASIGR